MLRPLRTAISVAVLVGGLWAAFAVELGDKTFAEHVDGISETPEAKQLVEDTRETINPALAEVRDRVLGEYVEAPTWIPEGSPAATPMGPSPTATRTEVRARPKPGREPPSAGEPPLPGRRGAKREAPEGFEPALPGRR